MIMVIVANIRKGRRATPNCRPSDESAAASLGISVYGAKLYAFALAGGIAAVAGVLTAYETPNIVFSQFDVFGSINAVVQSVIGGIGWISEGAISGALFAQG